MKVEKMSKKRDRQTERETGRKIAGRIVKQNREREKGKKTKAEVRKGEK